MDLGMQLERDLSPARYLRQHLEEFSPYAEGAIVAAAIEAAVALEDCNSGRARRQWRRVLKAARAAGGTARRDGTTLRRLASQVDRLRQAMETVLFDGFLPPDLAASAARSVAKMCTRAVERALCAYWAEGEGNAGGAGTRASHSSARSASQPPPPFRRYEPEPRVRVVDRDVDLRT